MLSKILDTLMKQTWLTQIVEEVSGSIRSNRACSPHTENKRWTKRHTMVSKVASQPCCFEMRCDESGVEATEKAREN